MYWPWYPIGTCFGCGALFNPIAYGYPKQRCRVCELIGVPTGGW